MWGKSTQIIYLLSPFVLQYLVGTISENMNWHISICQKQMTTFLSKTPGQVPALYIILSSFTISWRQIHSPQQIHSSKTLLFTVSFFQIKKKYISCSQTKRKQKIYILYQSSWLLRCWDLQLLMVIVKEPWLGD